MLKKIISRIKNSKSILITAHVNPDGDAIGSEVALYEILTGLGKDVCVINNHPTPEIYRFLKHSDKIVTELADDIRFDIAIALDTPNLKRLGSVESFLERADFVINIDHHESNQEYADLNYVDKTASAVGEIIFEMAEWLGVSLSKNIAQSLFVSIQTDTGSFSYSNTTSKTFLIASKLSDAGIDVNYISNKVYNTKPLKSYKLLTAALDTLTVEGHVGYMILSKDMFERTNTTPEDTDKFIDYIRSVEEVDIAIIFKELKDNLIKVSLRSKGAFDVNKFTNKYNGGGHPGAAGFTVEGANMDEIVKMVIKDITSHCPDRTIRGKII